MFSDWLRRLAARAFTKPPDEPIWQWADREVIFKKKHSAKPRYISSDRPWTRWLQDIARKPWRMRKGKLTRIRRVRIKKCTQSGFTEAILNIIRWCAKFRPRNFIYSINSKEEALNIRERLVDTLGRLGEAVFKDGEAPEDLQQYVMRLRDMIGWWIGSFSQGAFSNKYAPLVITDELDDHATFAGNATSLDLIDERLKTADEDALSIALGKPKLKGGPIETVHATGDQFEWMVPCPCCGTYQLLTWERVRFAHCQDLFKKWDMERVLEETFYECVEGCHIRNAQKPWMEELGRWWLVEFGDDPETVSLLMTDIHSMDSGSTWGHLAKEFIEATHAAKKGDFAKLQIFKNGRLGEGFEQRVSKVELTDILACRSAYRRGIIPHKGLLLAMGMDVGLFFNTHWVTLALNPATVEAWLIDWGEARVPSDLLDLMKTKTYLCPHTGIKQGIALAFIDCRYLRDQVYATALQMPRRIWPTLGLRPGISARSIGFTQVPQKPQGFGVITYIDADAKSDLYIDRIKAKRPPRLHVPEDAEEEMLIQFTHERMIEDPITHRVEWAVKPTGPNHKPDGVKIVLTGYDYLIDGPRTRASGIQSEIAAAPPPAAPAEPGAVDLELLTSESAPGVL